MKNSGITAIALTLIVTFGVVLVGAQEATPVATPKPCVLLFSKTAAFRHESIPDGVKCVTEILAPAVEVVATEDSAAFNLENLKRFRGVVFLSTTGDVLNAEQQVAFQSFIEEGGGFAGIHAASDTEYEWPWFAELIGAHFAGHPDVQSAKITVEDHSHASTAMLPKVWQRTDEWYRFNRNPRTVAGIHVLATLDESTYSGGGMGADHPCVWWRTMGKGRAWYTAGGHTKASFAEPLFRQHLKAGILWSANLQPSRAQATAPSGH